MITEKAATAGNTSVFQWGGKQDSSLDGVGEDTPHCRVGYHSNPTRLAT